MMSSVTNSMSCGSVSNYFGRQQVSQEILTEATGNNADKLSTDKVASLWAGYSSTKFASDHFNEIKVALVHVYEVNPSARTIINTAVITGLNTSAVGRESFSLITRSNDLRVSLNVVIEKSFSGLDRKVVLAEENLAKTKEPLESLISERAALNKFSVYTQVQEQDRVDSLIASARTNQSKLSEALDLAKEASENRMVLFPELTQTQEQNMRDIPKVKESSYITPNMVISGTAFGAVFIALVLLVVGNSTAGDDCDLTNDDGSTPDFDKCEESYKDGLGLVSGSSTILMLVMPALLIASHYYNGKSDATEPAPVLGIVPVSASAKVEDSEPV
jgi:hypothetical protein